MARKKTMKDDNGKKVFTLSLRDDESLALIKWLYEQGNLSDSLRYLIEQEIKQNGIRNLQKHIPAVRDPISLEVLDVKEPKRDTVRIILDDENEKPKNTVDKSLIDEYKNL